MADKKDLKVINGGNKSKIPSKKGKPGEYNKAIRQALAQLEFIDEMKEKKPHLFKGGITRIIDTPE